MYVSESNDDNLFGLSKKQTRNSFTVALNDRSSFLLPIGKKEKSWKAGDQAFLSRQEGFIHKVEM